MREETAQNKMLPQPNIDVAFATARLVRSEQYRTVLDLESTTTATRC